MIKELTKNQAYCTLIAKVDGLVKVVRISSVANDKLVALCGKVAVRDYATRWNSVLLMIERILDDLEDLI